MTDNLKSTPKYVWLADKLKQQIHDGVFKADEKLLSENELCKMYGISRITVRQALKILESQNLISTFHGKGTFVKVPALTTHIPEVVSISKKLSNKGLNGYTKIESFSRSIENLQVMEFLNLDESDTISQLRLTAVIENLPSAYYESYFEKSLAEKVYNHAQMLEKEKKAFTSYDIYSLLGIKLSYANQSITAANPIVEPSLSEDLPPDHALIILNSIFYDENDNAIEYRKALYRSDLYSFDITRTYSRAEI